MEYQNGKYQICETHDFWHERMRELCPMCPHTPEPVEALTYPELVDKMKPTYRDQLATESLVHLLKSPIIIEFYRAGYLDAERLSVLSYKLADEMIKNKMNFEAPNDSQSK